MVKNFLLTISFLAVAVTQSMAQLKQSHLNDAVDELHNLLNERRKANDLPDLLNDPALGNAALSQAVYLIKSDDLTHDQKNSKKKTVYDRVKSEGGEFEVVFELLAEITSRESHMKRSELMDNLPAVITAWLVREPDLASEKYSHAGISVVHDTKRDLVFCVLVLAKSIDN